MKHNYFLMSCMIGLYLLCSGRLFADTIRFDSDKTQIVFTEGKEKAVLKGRANVVTDKSRITAQEIELYGKDYQFILCKGKVTAHDTEKDTTITADRLFLDRKENITRAEGNAVMENRKDELVIKGGYLENRKDDNLTIIQIGVRILKKDMVARAEFARYNDKEKKLELSGMPHVYWKGDEYKATRIIINTETDEIELQGEVSGSVKSTGGKSEKTEGTPTQGNTGTPVPSAPVRPETTEEKRPTPGETGGTN